MGLGETLQGNLGAGSSKPAVPGRNYKTAADRKRGMAPSYKAGQQVWVSTKHLQLGVTSKKLDPRFVGPFPISKVINPVSVKLRLK